MSNPSSFIRIKAQHIMSLLLITGFGLSYTTAQAQTYTTPQPAPSASAAPGTAAGAQNAVSLKVQTGSQGSYLVDSQGRSLYVFAADSANTSTCTGACAQVWPALTVAAGQTAQAQAGVASNLIGTITRADGTRQVTYNSQPLYYYSLDQSPGQTNGQGITSFGALWYLVQPNGSPLVPTSAAGTAAVPSGTATGAAGTSASCTTSTDAFGNTIYSGNCAGAAGTSAGCSISMDAFGNLIYSGNCAGVAGTFSGCTFSTDAFGNMIFSGNCAGTAPFVFVPGQNQNHNQDHDHQGH